MMDTVDLLEDLIRCAPVTAEVDRVNRASDMLAEYLDGAGLYTVMEEVDGRRVLYAATAATQTPAVLLNAHVDVVPASSASQFEPVQQDGWLVGRGSTDCLGHAALAAQVLVRLRGRACIGAVFSSDEEIGGATTAAMVARGYGAGRLILVLDGAAYAIAVAQKGIVTVRLVAWGRACHASEPWNGINAIDRLLDGYLEVRDEFPAVCKGDEWHTTVVAAQVSGGTVPNRVPDRADMTLNIRFTDMGGDADIVGRLQRLSGLDLEVLMTCPPVVFDESLPIFQTLAEVMEKALGKGIRTVRMNGATDARHFVGLDVPVAILGVPGRDVHGADERVEIEGLRAYEEMLVDFLGASFAGSE